MAIVIVGANPLPILDRLALRCVSYMLCVEGIENLLFVWRVCVCRVCDGGFFLFWYLGLQADGMGSASCSFPGSRRE